jgi:hypothetical protein
METLTLTAQMDKVTATASAAALSLIVNRGPKAMYLPTHSDGASFKRSNAMEMTLEWLRAIMAALLVEIFLKGLRRLNSKDVK